MAAAARHVLIGEALPMKFIKLESRGGNYLVVASNVAWLRTAENGQTNVGIVGGQPLLVVGSVEEVAEKILAGLAGGDAEAPTNPAPVTAAAPPAVVQSVAEAPPASPAAPQPEPDREPEPEPVSAVPEPEPVTPRPATPARPRPISARSASMWERPAGPASKSLKVTSGSQRMMGQIE